MASRTIAIVTEEFDPHADALIQLLHELDQDPVRVHPADLPRAAGMDMSFDGRAWHGSLRLRHRTLPLESIHSVWWRKPQQPEGDASLMAVEKDFVETETRHALHGFWRSLDCYWMNFPGDMREASFKPEQLQRAASLGFDVPRTIVTTDADAVRAFAAEIGGQVVYKVLENPLVRLPSDGDVASQEVPARKKGGRAKGIYTTPLASADLDALQSLDACPCLFQELVPKDIELRVTVIGEAVFALEIHSQAHERTRNDWRHYDVTIPRQKANLPDDVAARCLALTKSYGLQFGAIDLVRTPDGRYVFLEINPNGQWLFCQLWAPELKMKEHLAACLIRGND